MDEYNSLPYLAQYQDFSNDDSNYYLGDEFAQLSPDNISTPSYFQEQPVWRCATMPESEPVLLSAFSTTSPYSFERPTLNKQPYSVRNETIDNLKTAPTFAVSRNQAKVIPSFTKSVPEVPLLVMPNNFETKLPSESVCVVITDVLHEITGLSSECNADHYEWNATCVQGSSHCKLEIHLYSKTGSLIVECNRLSGDSKLFRSIYNQLEKKMSDRSSSIPMEVVETSSVPVFAMLPDEEESSSSCCSAMLEPILRMAADDKREAQLEASRILCDLSTDESMPQLLCEGGCVSVLRDLLSNTVCDWARLHAVSTLANLSDSALCQEAIIKGGVLPILLQFASDGPYQTAELRRLAAYTLANVSKRLSPLVIDTLGPAQVSGWLKSIDNFKDQRLKLQALRAKEFLSVLISV